MPETPPISLAEVQRELIRREGFAGFCKRAWHLLEDAPLSWSWHHDIVCQTVERLYRGEFKKCIINVPPGCTKTTIITKLFPAWAWAQDPGERIITASYDHSLMAACAGEETGTLRVVLSAWYKALYPHVEISEGPKAAASYHTTTAKGWRFSTSSPHGKLTGRHGSIKIIDDPLKPDGVDGAALQSVNRWYGKTWSTRNSSEKTRELIIMQRLSEDDLCGYLEKEFADEIAFLKLPMEFTGEKHPLNIGGVKDRSVVDPREKVGDLLWPGRYGQATVKSLKRVLGIDADAQLQQDPTPATGIIFKQEWMQEWDWKSLPVVMDRVILSGDLTFTDTTGTDRVAWSVWGQAGSLMLLLYAEADRRSFVATLSDVLRLYERWNPDVTLIEAKANGHAVMNAIQGKIPGVVAIKPTESKVVRATAVTGYYMAGDVRFGPINLPGQKAVRKEHLGFPRMTHDDLVDSCTQAVSWAFSDGKSMYDRIKEIQGLSGAW